MKKLMLNPLSLDKETIAKLDEKQLLDIVGGEEAPGSTGCGTGSSTCDNGGSTGCGSGSSTCDGGAQSA